MIHQKLNSIRLRTIVDQLSDIYRAGRQRDWSRTGNGSDTILFTIRTLNDAAMKHPYRNGKARKRRNKGR